MSPFLATEEAEEAEETEETEEEEEEEEEGKEEEEEAEEEEGLLENSSRMYPLTASHPPNLSTKPGTRSQFTHSSDERPMTTSSFFARMKFCSEK